MHPVIPKVRVGDILLGTKNLRNWLHTASLLSYVNQLADPHCRNPKKSSLYLPTKKDRFVVAVNAWETFAVWGLGRDTVVLFCNPVTPPSGRSPQPRGHSDRDQSEPAMSPALFAQWFIRTQGKRPDLLNTWPNHAYYLWASLQMNGISNPNHRLSYTLAPGIEAPFTTHLHNDSSKGPIREHVEQDIRYGLPRHKQRRRSVIGYRAYGPSLRDISRWRENIREVTSNPRVMKKLKEQVTVEVPQAVYDLIVNQ